MDFLNPPARTLSDKRLFLFDLDGTLYLGERALPGAVRFVRRLRESGRRVLFATNNASEPDSFWLDRLARMGFDPSPDEMLTSARVTISYLREAHAGQTVYLLGTERLRRQFLEGGVRLLSGGEERADVVVSSFDTELTYRKVYDACRLIRGGAVYLSTHQDLNCPTDGGLLPDSGSIAAMITASTGVAPRFLGKPSPVYLDRLSRETGLPLGDMCVFGDRLCTDIALGRRNGILAALVLTGETNLEDLADLPEGERPDFVFPTMDAPDRLLFG